MLYQCCVARFQNYPLETEQLKLVCTIEESLGNLYKFQLKKPEAFCWYRKALNSLQELLDELLDAEDERYFTESKGMGKLVSIKALGARVGHLGQGQSKLDCKTERSSKE